MGENPFMMLYHDTEWGVPVHDDRTLFEFLILEGAQAGLTWQTVLNKREQYCKAFSGFDAKKGVWLRWSHHLLCFYAGSRYGE